MAKSAERFQETRSKKKLLPTVATEKAGSNL
jgi:hypothetical protein